MVLKGKTALVTGAGSGIGKSCAMLLAKAGARVVVNDRPGSVDLQETAAAIRKIRRECHTVEADVFSRDGREILIESAFHLVDRIDIFVSNPALNYRESFLDLDLCDFERVVAGSLTSGFHMSQLVARSMVATDTRGRIIFISSVLAEMPFANNVAYAASKAGLNQMARTISVELAKYRINVNTIEPGWIDTPGERKWASDDELNQEGRDLPWSRLGTAEDIAKAVVFLSSDASDYITGVCIPVDGGFRFKDCVAKE